MNTLIKILSIVILGSIFVSCAPTYRQHQVYSEPEPMIKQDLATEVYYYPLRGQSVEQQDRDRFECYLWAKDQTGFDPSYPYLAPHQRTYVVPDPEPGRDLVAGAFTGAVLGAMIGSPHHAGEGAVIGALAGGVLGAASDSERIEHSKIVQERYAGRTTNQQVNLERQASNYRRAMKACLEGRHYSVR